MDHDFNLSRKNLIAALDMGLISWFEYFSEWCRLAKLESEVENAKN